MESSLSKAETTLVYCSAALIQLLGVGNLPDSRKTANRNWIFANFKTINMFWVRIWSEEGCTQSGTVQSNRNCSSECGTTPANRTWPYVSSLKFWYFFVFGSEMRSVSISESENPIKSFKTESTWIVWVRTPKITTMSLFFAKLQFSKHFCSEARLLSKHVGPTQMLGPTTHD